MKISEPHGWSKSFAGSLYGFFRRSGNDNFRARISHFKNYIDNINPPEKQVYFRLIESATDRTVKIRNQATGAIHEVVMFGSNNYLGLANHPHVQERVSACMREYGVGIAGPPVLNGYHKLTKELEERLSRLKNKEDTLLFSSGFTTNIGIISTLASERDIILYDEASHASFKMGLKLFRGRKYPFRHNNLKDLSRQLAKLPAHPQQTIFIGIEGVYSMDGDLAPLPEFIKLARNHNAVLILDDAHGTGVLGEKGGGTAEHFECQESIDINMGTFSKCFGVTGGFVSSDRETINYLRYNAQPYLFSAAMPPITLAAILGGLDVMEQEPWRRLRLLELAGYATAKLAPLGLCVPPEAAIIAVKKPEGMDIRDANQRLLEMGVFVNTVEFPAVSREGERFRISLSAVHTRADIDLLVDSMERLFRQHAAGTPDQ